MAIIINDYSPDQMTLKFTREHIYITFLPFMGHLTHSVVNNMVFSGPYYIVMLNKNHILFSDFTEKMKKNNYQIDF